MPSTTLAIVDTRAALLHATASDTSDRRRSPTRTKYMSTAYARPVPFTATDSSRPSTMSATSMLLTLTTAIVTFDCSTKSTPFVHTHSSSSSAPAENSTVTSLFSFTRTGSITISEQSAASVHDTLSSISSSAKRSFFSTPTNDTRRAPSISTTSGSALSTTASVTGCFVMPRSNWLNE